MASERTYPTRGLDQPVRVDDTHGEWAFRMLFLALALLSLATFVIGWATGDFDVHRLADAMFIAMVYEAKRRDVRRGWR